MKRIIESVRNLARKLEKFSRPSLNWKIPLATKKGSVASRQKWIPGGFNTRTQQVVRINYRFDRARIKRE